MATGVTAGVKRSRSEAPVYYGHLAAKRSRALLPRVTDVGALLKSDAGGFTRFEARVSVLNGLGLTAVHVAQLLRLVGNDAGALLALIDLNGCEGRVAAVLRDLAARDVPITALNLSAHSFCMNDKFAVARAFIAAHERHTTACDVLEFVVQTVFAQDNSVAVRVLSGGGVRDVLLAEWCRMYKFCTDAQQVPNLVFVVAESGKTFLLPFAA